MAQKYTNRMKATVWTPTMRADLDGTPDGVIPHAFYALDTKERRAKCIAELQKIDAKLTASETNKGGN